MVSSVERPSTSTTSDTMSGSAGMTCGRFAASFFAGMMTLTFGTVVRGRLVFLTLHCSAVGWSSAVVPTWGPPVS